MKNARAALIAAALLSIQAQAQSINAPPSARKQFAFNGVGAHSCGKYIEYRKQNNQTITLLYQQWGAGFMAGASNEGNATVSADLETYTTWLDKWCADDPASNVVGGIIALAKRLMRDK